MRAKSRKAITSGVVIGGISLSDVVIVSGTFSITSMLAKDLPVDHMYGLSLATGMVAMGLLMYVRRFLPKLYFYFAIKNMLFGKTKTMEISRDLFDQKDF